MNHSLRTTGERRGPRHGAFQVIVAMIGCYLLTACSGRSGSTPTETLTFSESVVFLEPGEATKVLIGSSLRTPSLKETTPLQTRQPLPGSPLTYSLDSPPGARPSELNIEVAADAAPGVYRVPFSIYGEPVPYLYRVVVVPTDATPRVGAIASVAAGEFHSLALGADGTVWAWGHNDFGQLGDGTLIDRTVPIQVVGLPQPAIAVAAGVDHSLVVLQDKSVWGWGKTEHFRLRTQGSHIDAQPLPELVTESAFSAVEVAAGQGHSMLRNDRGEVMAWGDGSSGQTASNHTQLLRGVTGLPPSVTRIEAEHDVSYAVLADGSLWAWGDGSDGQLGPTANGPQNVAWPVQTISGANEVQAGRRHTLVLSNGTVRAFGGNFYSQLGDGSRAFQVEQAVIVPRLLSVQQIAAGRFHSLALQSDQRVLQWGLSVNGQAGVPVAPPNDRRNYQLLPEVVTGLPSASAIDAGGRHSMAVTTASQSVYAWGNNSLGQLGDGGIANSRSAVVPVYGSGGPNAERHALTLLANGRGIVNATVGGNQIVDQGDASRGLALAISQGAVVTLTAVPDSGSAFLGWGGQASGSSPTVQVTMNRSRACLAQFGVIPIAKFDAAMGPSTVLARAEPATDSDGCVVLWQWDLGNDGSIDATGREYEFSRPEQTTDLRLVVTDNDGLVGESIQTIQGSGGGNGGNTGNNGLTADFYVLPEQPLAMFPTDFSGLTSSSPNGPLSNWQWDFTNDGTFDASGSQVTFTYNAPGTYSVRLEITDQQGQKASVTRDVVVIQG